MVEAMRDWAAVTEEDGGAPIMAADFPESTSRAEDNAPMWAHSS